MGLAAMLGGCLEVDQHPPWQDGVYDGKIDQRTPDSRHQGHRPAWQEEITARNHLQDEYRRTGR